MRQVEVIDRILARAERIAIVGLSDDPTRPSHEVARALRDRGYTILPVNPNVDEVLGIPAHDTLADVPGRIDVVDVFRDPEILPDVARAAVAAGAGAVWAQLGLVSEQARRIATAGGLDYVEDACLRVEAGRRDSHPPARIDDRSRVA